MEHWTDDFEHESITDENREPFKTAMSKYDSLNAAVVGGFNAQKEAGRPYKLPKTLDSLPDDTSRDEFRAGAHKLLGIEVVKNAEALADLDMKIGLAEGVEPDENLINTFKAFVVENKISKGDAQKMVGFYNQIMGEARNAHIQQAEANKTEAAAKTNEALIAHYGSKEKVAEQSELLRRAIQNSGITPEEYEKVGDAMANSILTKDPVMALTLLKLLAPLAAEGTSLGGKGGAATAKPQGIKQDLPKTGKALGWDK